MRRIRSHLTYANITATLSLFLVVGGGTALASYVVSSNSQVGPGTISGHNPPSGKHANIIGGSVNATDLAKGAVTGGKIGAGAVTAPKLALPVRLPQGCKNGQLAIFSSRAPGSWECGRNAHPIRASITSAKSGPQTAGVAGPWTFTLTCPSSGPASFTVHGPGEIGGTTIIGGSPATSYVGPMTAIGGGFTTTVATGGTAALDDQLSAALIGGGNTLDQMNAVVSATNSGGVEHCSVVGETVSVT